MAFQSLNMYFTISNMTVVGSQVHGFTPEDVQQDKEEMQTMRTLGLNIAWQLKISKPGKRLVWKLLSMKTDSGPILSDDLRLSAHT